MTTPARANPGRIDGRRLSRGTSQAIRHLAVKAVARGDRPSEIMARYGFCRTTIYRWLRTAARHGERALDRRPHPGRRPRVTRSDAESIRDSLIGHSPSDLGVAGTLWTRTAVARLVERRLKMWIGPMGATRLLRRVGLQPRGAAVAGLSLLYAVDGRGSFLCERRRPNETPADLRRMMGRLSSDAGRPVRFFFAGAAVEPDWGWSGPPRF